MMQAKHVDKATVNDLSSQVIGCSFTVPQYT